MTPNCCVRTRPVPPQSAYDNSLCRDAMEIVMESYGAEVGNSAIKFMPFGGLYIAGGIAMKNLSHIQARAPSKNKPVLVRLKNTIHFICHARFFLDVPAQ